MGRHIGETAAGKVDVAVGGVVLFGGGADVLGQVGVDGGFLVGWGGEVEAEASGARVPCLLGIDELVASDGGDVGAGSCEEFC